MKQYHRKPTELQQRAFQHLKSGLTKQEAMLKAGYSHVSSLNPKVNLTERAGMRTLIEQYREELRKAGVSMEVLAEVEAAGLFDDNSLVRLGYLKENKKSLGLTEEAGENIGIRILAIPSELIEKWDQPSVDQPELDEIPKP